MSLFVIALLAFGLLLWARFLLVTSHPRTAIARPADARQVVGADAPEKAESK